MDEAVQISYNAIFPNQGQCCCAGSRTFVHADIYDAFVQKATELAVKRRVGNPFEDGVDQGPQVSEEQLNKVMDLVNSGIEEGASLKCGGKRWGSEGYFVEPTVFADVTDDMRIAKEEVKIANNLRN